MYFTELPKVRRDYRWARWCNMSAETDDRPTNDRPIHPDLGLCRTCQAARRIESDRGSIFFRCELSFEDSRFAKYPRLPVLVCNGYRPK